MLLLRVVVIAVCLVMLLPADPALRHNQVAGQNSARFCDRYPKTCDASGELWSAFTRKLVYGVKLARQSLVMQSEPYGEHYGTSKLGGRLDEWRPRPPTSGPATYANGTLRPEERSSDWYRNH